MPVKGLTRAPCCAVMNSSQETWIGIIITRSFHAFLLLQLLKKLLTFLLFIWSEIWSKYQEWNFIYVSGMKFNLRIWNESWFTYKLSGMKFDLLTSYQDWNVIYLYGMKFGLLIFCYRISGMIVSYLKWNFIYFSGMKFDLLSWTEIWST